MSDITPAVREELSLLTVPQVCELLQVTRQWLYDEVEAGRFPYVRMGKKMLRFRPAEVQAWLSGMRPEPVQVVTGQRPFVGKPRKSVKNY